MPAAAYSWPNKVASSGPVKVQQVQSHKEWASHNSISQCPIWPLVRTKHWASIGLESPISPVYDCAKQIAELADK